MRQDERPQTPRDSFGDADEQPRHPRRSTGRVKNDDPELDRATGAVDTVADVWRKDYVEYSETTSRVVRQLSYAAVGIIWVMKPPEVLPAGPLLWGLLLTVGALAADFFQYLVATIVLRYMLRQAEQAHFKATGRINSPFVRPSWMDKPAFAFFLIKCALVSGAYVAIAWSLVAAL